jgi:alginate O-acetyltransferase complex protein AlgI
MLFSSLTFLALFLPAFLAVYYMIPAQSIRLKNIILLVFSLCFYAVGEPVYILILILSGLWNYTIGLFITHCRIKWQAKALLVLSLCGSLGPLCAFKYGASFLRLLGAGTTFTALLPIGISFYTFQAMSYMIDLYKGYIKPQRDLVTFMTYFSMFPQIGAGPIIRYADIEDRLTQRRVTLAAFSEGITRFTAGLGKKVILANHAGKITAELLNVSPDAMTTAGIWLGAAIFVF